MKFCSRCKQEKDLSEFNKDRTRPGGIYDWCKACTREYDATWYKAHQVESRKAATAYQKAHPEKTREISMRRYARQKATMIEKVDYKAILERDGLWCYLCEKDVEPHEVNFDHVIPLNAGGPHTADNIRVTHAVCNRRKGARILEST